MGKGTLADGICMSRIERRYERVLTALKAIAHSMANAVFRVEDYPGSKPMSDTASSRRSRHQGHNRQGNSEKPAEKRAGRVR
jgi:hypothetical protein